MDQQPVGQITVLGAGVVGLCCAVSLQNEGFDVTLIDRDEPGRGTSYGNAGLIHVDGVVPIATPGILRRAPGMLLNPNGPLVIRWRYLHRIAPWLWQFIRAARPGRVETISSALASLLFQASESWSTLIQQAEAGNLWRQSGELHVYRSRSAWDGARSARELRRRRGSSLQELTVEEIRQLEPALSRNLHAGVFTPDGCSITSPYDLSRKLTDLFRRNGGDFIKANVTEIRPEAPGSAVTLHTENDRLRAERLVISAGAFSRPFADAVGARIPLDTERGYHLSLPDPGIELRRPVIIGDHFFAASPMTGGIRLAGTAEFAGLALPPYWRRSDILGELARPFFPGLNLSGSQRWIGYRPALPDSLPVIGPAEDHPNVYFAFGHGHLGLTMAAVTGKLIAELATGNKPAVDLAPFGPNRF